MFDHNDLTPGDNLFAIRGDEDDETRVEISNIRLEIKLHTGSPNLVCNRDFSLNPAAVGDTISVRNYFSNVGSNTATNVEYDFGPLPYGVILSSGSIIGSIVAIAPGETNSQEFFIIPEFEGQAEFLENFVRYEDPAGENYESNLPYANLEIIENDAYDGPGPPPNVRFGGQ